MKSWLKRLIAIGAIALAASACSPSELQAYMRSIGAPISDAQAQEQAAAINRFNDEQSSLHRFDYALSDAQLGRLRACESGGNYRAVSRTGAYRGAYQFSRTTWNSVARANFPQHVGLDPAAAPPDVQDAFARALFAQLGRSPWPICGQRI